MSIVTLQEIDSIGEGLLHPSLLTTLVYRFGMPGKVFRQVSEAQANGQYSLFSQDALEACGGFVEAYNSVCEDITIARTLVATGYPVGYYEADDLVSVNLPVAIQLGRCALQRRHVWRGLVLIRGGSL